jgi:hypothetical protein
MPPEKTIIGVPCLSFPRKRESRDLKIHHIKMEKVPGFPLSRE